MRTKVKGVPSQRVKRRGEIRVDGQYEQGVRLNGRKVNKTERRTDGRTDKQKDGRWVGRMDGQIVQRDGQTDGLCHELIVGRSVIHSPDE